MASVPNNLRDHDSEAKRAAKKLLRHYRHHVVKHLVDKCNPIQLLKDACEYNGQDYYEIMAPNYDTEDDTKSHISHHRTLSTNSHSEMASSSSVAFSSSGSGDSSSDFLWVMPAADHKQAQSLAAASLPRSDFLIQADVVRTRLMLPLKNPSGQTVVRYNGGPIVSNWTISLSWGRSVNDLKSGRAQRNTFYVVDELPDKEIVLSDSFSRDKPAYPKVSTFNHGARTNSYGGSPIEDIASLNSHNFHFQQAPPTHSVTENSTVPPTRQPFIDRSSPTQRGRRQSNASESSISKIPKPMAARSSNIGSASTTQSRAPAGRVQHERPLRPPHPSKAGATSSLKVTVVYGKSMMTFNVELDATGEIFYESLYGTIFQTNGRQLNRDVDVVRFTPQKKDFHNCCRMSLVEDQVADDWENAVEWMKDLQDEGPCKIYAVVGPIHDDIAPH